MRVTPKLRQSLADAILPLDTPERRARYLAGDFPRADKVKDLDKRYRWDLVWSSPASGQILGVIYRVTGANDNHVDTALRAIVRPLGESEWSNITHYEEAMGLDN